MLGSEEMGHWSEQLLRKVARMDDGHTRSIQTLPHSPRQPSIPSRSGSIRWQRMLSVPILGTKHMMSSHILPFFGNFRHVQNKKK